MSALIEGQPGGLSPDDNGKHWVTPLTEFFVEHPTKATALVAAIAGLGIGLAVKSLSIPGLNNYIEQLTKILYQ